MAFLWRLLRAVCYMAMLIHVNACVYYAISRIQGRWEGRERTKYILKLGRCPYHALAPFRCYSQSHAVGYEPNV